MYTDVQTRKRHTHACTRAPGGVVIRAQVVRKSKLTGQYPAQHPITAMPSRGPDPGSREAPSLEEDGPTSHSPVVRLFRRNSICSVCPACSARARGVGTSGSPEKQLTPAPQPRSAWVSARSEVVTAAHRAWEEGRGVGRVSLSQSEGQVGQGSCCGGVGVRGREEEVVTQVRGPSSG